MNDLTADSDDDKFLNTPSKMKSSSVSQVELQRGLNKANGSLLSIRIAGQHFGAGPFLRNRRNTNGIPGNRLSIILISSTSSKNIK